MDKPPTKRAFAGLTGRYEPEDSVTVAPIDAEPPNPVVPPVVPSSSTKRVHKQKKRQLR